MDTKVLERLRLPIRRSALARLFEAKAELTPEERKLRERFADERALDLGIPDLPRYGDMFNELAAQKFGRRFERALWHPDQTVGLRWPLNSSELASLVDNVDRTVACSSRTIDRLAEEELISPPLLLGLGEERPLRVYFGRHFVEIAYWQLKKLRPEVERARLQGLRTQFEDHAREVFWTDHPSIGGSMLGRAARR